MAESEQQTVLERPRVYLVRMVVFTILVFILALILFPQIHVAFMANPGLNGLIVFTLILGIGYAFRMVWRLYPEVNWLNDFRVADPDRDSPYTPHLLAPMATLLRDRQGTAILSTMSMRTLLDSLASRLDESRDISRYLIGLLIFLGLLGTFWGLLETVTSVGQAIRQLDVASAESSTIFEELKAGLEAPLAGMGTSFSSSLFGLAGSLVLGFLDLQASQAQNRFYNDLENWLSTITDIEVGDAGSYGFAEQLQLDMNHLQRGISRINETLEEALSDGGGAVEADATDSASIDKLADAVGGLVLQMREEQKMVRQWAQEQSAQRDEIQRMLARAGVGVAEEPAGRLRGAFKPSREQG